MYILGISCFYHDASAALLKDGKILAAAQEERFTRKKHDVSFPIQAIEYCLKSQNITIKDIAYIGFYEKPFLKFERLLYQHLEKFPSSYKIFLSSLPSWLNEKLRVVRLIKQKLRYSQDILFIEHHLAHAAGSFLPCPFERAAILSVDGVGEWTTTAYGIGEKNDITLLKEIKFPTSLGLLYSTITAYLGFTVNNSEYKCLHPDTQVLFSNGKMQRIKELFNLQGKIKKISDTEEILRLRSKIELVSLNKNTLKLTPNKTDIVYRKKADTELYEVELLSGRKVTVTKNHKFTSTSSFGEVYSTEAKDLKKGDFVAIPRRINISTTPNKKYFDWAKLLAYSIAEGHELIRRDKHEAEIRIGLTDEKIIDDIKETLKKLGKSYRTWKPHRSNMFYIGITVWKNLDFLNSIGYEFGKRAGTKSVPCFVLSSNKKIQKNFLTALFDCDGGFIGHQIIYSTKSEILANQISYLLLNFGIHSRIRKVLNKIYNKYYYRIEINGKDLKEFDKKIGFSAEEKNRKLKFYLSTIKEFGNNLDFIPINDYILKRWLEFGKNKKELYKNIGYHFWDYETEKRYATSRLLIRINELLQDDKIEKFIESDIYFDRVKSIKPIRFNGYVYDVFMPEHHTFVGGFGGIILHNTMGLAAYGNMNKKTNPYYEKLKKVMDIKEDGSYRFNMGYFDYVFKNRMPSKKLCALLEGKIRKPEEELTQRHKDIAAALQLITEEVMTKMLNHVHKITKSDNLVIGGGVGLNSVYNGKILRNTPFKRIWIQPDPGDGGTSVGAALYVYNTLLGNKRRYVMSDAYLGPEYTAKEIRSFLDSHAIKYSEFKDNKEIIKETAKLIYENNVVGWFQGRMEWGPRALGARSILSNPTNKNMQEILNLKVKHREKFRPFAPVVCEEDALRYFECDRPIPEITDFMLMVYPVKKKWRSKIPAVTHVDGSGRLQTIRRTQNKRYYDLIKEFGRLSGIPILINTSFNIRGEPIVCKPSDAYKCMMGTGIDYLIMNHFLIKREDNPRDIWDSEKYAKD